MKQFLIVVVLSLSVLRGFGQDGLPDKPNPPRLVNDYVGLLQPDQVRQLEKKLDDYDDSTSMQIAVVIVKTTGNYDPVTYCVQLGRKWGVGNKGSDNGVIFLIATDDRKDFIAPGNGLEGAIPDITCESILANQVRPFFKQEDYYTGIDSGVNAIMRAAAGEYTAPAGYHQQSSGGSGAIVIIVIAIIFIIIIVRRGGGGPGGGYMSRRGSWVGPFLWGAAAGSIFGGSSGGGGFGGGGGGGFGGFGGGGFGGGGAGGSW